LVSFDVCSPLGESFNLAETKKKFFFPLGDLSQLLTTKR